MKVGRSHNESENMFHTRFRLHRKSDTEFQWKRKGTGDGSRNLISDIQSKDYSTYLDNTDYRNCSVNKYTDDYGSCYIYPIIYI